MKHLNSVVVLSMQSLLYVLASALALALAPGPHNNRKQRDVTCQDSWEYLNDGICCLNCPAGTYVATHCRTSSGRGHCTPCDFNTYTEYANGLTKCFQCTKCRPDQDPVELCTSTRNTQCQCKLGLYCLPDQACEACKTCSKCSEEEEVMKNCTSSSNTICRKRGSASDSVSQDFSIFKAVIITPIVILSLVFVCLLYWRWSARRGKAVELCCSRGFLKMCMGGGRETREVMPDNTQIPFITQMPGNVVGDQTPAWVKAAEEEDRGLGESLPNTATSSQSSLSVCVQLRPCQPYPGHCGPAPSSAHPWHLTLENEKIRRLIPLNGEESLKKSFDLFEEVDIHYHNRFFRYIGLSDNAIRNAETSSVEDKIYELLKAWMEKEGLKADFNSLVEALLHLDQRLSAENIIARAISNGYFKYEDD